jgi:hypothetical protein
LSAVANIRKAKPDEALELLRELVAEVKGLRADLGKHSRIAEPALVAAIEEHFGPARFTVRTMLEVVDENPHSALAEAVAALVDMNSSPRSRAVALGALLTRAREIETVAEQRGASIYRLRI